MPKKYYAIEQSGREAEITIYGEITSWPLIESDVSSYGLAKELEGLDADVINVRINSYGGEVAEGLAIYNALKRQKAHVKTYCDGFACSISSVIFMAGEERIMNSASLLMIHNAWTQTSGNAEELRKQADDLDAITQASINAYLSSVTISREELQTLLDKETWITPQQALDMGFATTIIGDNGSGKPNQSVRRALYQLIIGNQTAETATDPVSEPQAQEENPKENKVLKLLSAAIRQKGIENEK